MCSSKSIFKMSSKLHKNRKNYQVKLRGTQHNFGKEGEGKILLIAKETLDAKRNCSKC